MKDILAHTDWDSLMEGSVNDSWQNIQAVTVEADGRSYTSQEYLVN